MESLDDKNILQHLLNLEAEASALVEDAQAEADRRVSEAEKQCRSRYEATYAKEAERLEAIFVDETRIIRENYRKQLDQYRGELLKRPLDRTAFNALAQRLLFRELHTEEA